jgi:hypothetical protein
VQTANTTSTRMPYRRASVRTALEALFIGIERAGLL